MGWFDEQIRQRIENDDEVFSEAFAKMADVVMGNTFPKCCWMRGLKPKMQLRKF